MIADTHHRIHHQRIDDEHPDEMLATAMLDAVHPPIGETQ